MLQQDERLFFFECNCGFFIADPGLDANNKVGEFGDEHRSHIKPISGSKGLILCLRIGSIEIIAESPFYGVTLAIITLI